MESNIFQVTDKDIPQKVDCGFEGIDQVVGGFRYGNVYLIGGIEKSGKSSFLMQMANYMMATGNKISYLNTELPDAEFRTAITASFNKKDKSEVEKDIELQKDWLRLFQDKFYYSGVPNLVEEKSNTPSFEKLTIKAKEHFKNGVKIFFIDNLSTFANQDSNKTSWETLSKCGTRVVNFAKTTNSICFIVVHAKNNVAFSETPAGIRSYIQNNEPEKIFDESISVVKRLSSNDLHGGSVFRSQLSGTLLIWRPLQNFAKSKTLPRLTGVILESFRHAESGAMIMMDFDGAKGIFIEDELQPVLDHNKS